MTLVHPGMGHNSGVDWEAEAKRHAQRADIAEARARLLEQKISKRDERDAYVDAVLDSDVSTPAKLAGIRIVKAAHDTGTAQVRYKLLAKTASVKDERTIKRIVQELEDLRLMTTSRAPGSTKEMHLCPLADLQREMERYRLRKEAEEEAQFTSQPPTSNAGTSPHLMHQPPTSNVGSTSNVGGTWDVGSPPASGAGSPPTFDAGPQKGSPPLVPPLSPTPPFPPYNPPHSQNHGPNESSEQVDTSVDARKVRAPTNERGTRLPDDWQPDAALLAWVGVETRLPAERVRVETEKFRDHFHASSGANARKRKWGHAWRNWMRTASDSFARDQQRQARFSGQPVPMAAKPASTVWWKLEARLAEMTPERWRKGIAEHAAEKWSVPILGPPPGNHQCVVPKDLIAELKLTDIYDEHGYKRETRR